MDSKSAIASTASPPEPDPKDTKWRCLVWSSLHRSFCPVRPTLVKGALPAADAAAVAGTGRHPPPRAKAAAWPLRSHGTGGAVPAEVPLRRPHVGPPRLRSVHFVRSSDRRRDRRDLRRDRRDLRRDSRDWRREPRDWRRHPSCAAAGEAQAVTAVTAVTGMARLTSTRIVPSIRVRSRTCMPQPRITAHSTRLLASSHTRGRGPLLTLLTPHSLVRLAHR